MLQLECSIGLVRILQTGDPIRRDAMLRMDGLRLPHFLFGNVRCSAIGRHDNLLLDHELNIYVQFGYLRSNSRISGQLNRSIQRAASKILW